MGRAADLTAQRTALRGRIDQLTAELERLTAAVRAGGEAALVQSMRERERALATARTELSRLDRPRQQTSIAQAHEQLPAKLADWRALLGAHVPQARQMVRKLIAGRITFTPKPECRRYAFSIPGTLSRFFSGLVCPQGVASPTFAGWNQIGAWLNRLDALRRVA